MQVERPAPKLAVMFHRVGPYHWARVEAYALQWPTVLVELSAETAEYEWDKVSGESTFERITLFHHIDTTSVPMRAVVAQVRACLDRVRPDALAVPGYANTGTIAALQWCWEKGIPVVLMSESTARDQKRIWWKEKMKRILVTGCSAALVGGRPQREYLVGLGMPAERVFTGYDVVDNSYFDHKALEARSRRAELAARYRLPGRYFLACARFIAKKNVSGLLRAYAHYLQLVCGGQAGGGLSNTWKLVILGNGHLREQLLSEVLALGLEKHVQMPGFKQYPELPVYYGLASAFVHSSQTEQWGLVVNEAMASALPVLVSNRCGCAPDLVKDGENGWAFDPNDVEGLARLMLRTATLGPRLETMGQAGRRIISSWGPERFAEGIRAAVEAAIRIGSGKRRSLGARLLLDLMLRCKAGK